MIRYLLLLTFLLPLKIWGQYLLPNEEIIYSFETKNGKRMTLVKDKENNYIQYRFGTEKRIDLEFPKERTKKSWTQFKYNSYWRGGGKGNSGMEIDNLLFVNEGIEYIVFRTYFAETEKNAAGILITRPNKKEIRIHGLSKTIKGCICDLEDTGLIEKEDIGLSF